MTCTHTHSTVLTRRDLVRGLAAGTIAVYAAPLASCAYNEELGRSQLLFVDDNQLAKMSLSAWDEALKKEKLVADPKYKARVEGVGKRLAKAAGRDTMAWEYAVFDDKQLNAFVLPGGKVGVYKGLLDLVKNDDQLAAVMGHETGHVMARHSAERYSQQMAATVGLAVGQVAIDQTDSKHKREIAGILGAGVTFGVLLPYSRKHELEADKIGVDLMAKGGYKTRESVELWKLMSAANTQKPPEFMSTHPSDTTRIRELEAYILQKGYA
jgi:predicted Zn-dependent protease